MTTDGTVTTLLEQIVGESITTSRLDHRAGLVDPGAAAALPYPTDNLLTRTTQLVGTETGTVYVWATSVFCPGALPARVRTGLLTLGEPIGKLLRQNRVESFREILSIDLVDEHGQRRPAGATSSASAAARYCTSRRPSPWSASASERWRPPRPTEAAPREPERSAGR